MFSNNIAFYLLKNHSIKEDEFLIYKYGLSVLVTGVFQTLIIILLGIVTDSIVYTIIFLLVLSSERRFLGGYHANTKIECMVINIIMWCVATNAWRINLRFNDYYVAQIILIFSLYVTFRFAPVEDIHKPLNRYQIKHNRKKGLTILCVFFIVAMFFIKSSSRMSSTILITLVLVDVFILVGRRKNVKEKNL